MHLQGPFRGRFNGPQNGRFPQPGFGINPQGPMVALTVHHPQSLVVEKSYIANYEDTINFQEMTIFQISGTANFGGRIIFRRKDEDNDKLKYTELVIQGISGQVYESNRNDLELVFERRETANEIIFDVEFAHPDRIDARGSDREELKAEPVEPNDGESKRKRRK